MIRTSVSAALGLALGAGGCRGLVAGGPPLAETRPASAAAPRAPATSGQFAAAAFPASASSSIGTPPRGFLQDKPVKAAIGKPAPEFELKDLDGKALKLSSFKGKIVVLEWQNPACAESAYAWGEKGPLRTLPESLAARGIVWLSICSEDPLGAGRVEKLREFAKENGVKVPLLVDPTGTIGRAYGAKTAPHLFVISEKGVLVYQGALDNVPLGKLKGEGPRVNYVEAALADLRSGHAVITSATKPYGCAIRYPKP